jgi:DNA cross-link repair 1A protein
MCLTCFHPLADYQGLTRGFRHGKVYCSLITARLVNMRIGLSWDQLHVLPLNERVNVDGVYVTAIDANHCPGSVIILFEPPNGKVRVGQFPCNGI